MCGGDVYLLGGAQTDFARNWNKEGKGFVALLRQALEDGLAATGLGFDNVVSLNREGRVACFVGNFVAEKYVGQGHLGVLLAEVDPCFWGVPSARYEAACASGLVAIDAARSRVALGGYDVAIVVGWELMKTVDSRTGGDYLGYAALYGEEAKGVDFPLPKLFGRLVDAMLDKYGTEESRMMDAMAQISVRNYENAARNPKAQTRSWFMSLEQVKDRGSDTNPFVGGKLANSDCSQVTDGAAVAVLVSGKFVGGMGLRRLPRIKGWGHRVAPCYSQKRPWKRVAQTTFFLGRARPYWTHWAGLA